MQSTQQHLDALDAAINQRLNGGAYDGYGELGQEFRGAPLDKLYAIRRDLLERLSAESGTSFGLAEPFGDGNGSPGPIALW